MNQLAAVKISSRGNELYGPNRCLAREDARKKQTEDHVQQNFRRGVEIVHSNHTFQTITAGNFGCKNCPEYRRVKSKNRSYIHFGSEVKPFGSVTQSDYAGITTPEFQHHVPKGLHSNNLADFAPQYRVDDTTGYSQYAQDFTGERSKDASQTASGALKFHNSTHFQLGDDLESPASETRLSFRGDRGGSDSASLVSQADKDRTKSSVFRDGDYNMMSPNTKGRFVSTHKRDFVDPPAAGVSTVTRMPYSHVIPKESSESAVGVLRKLLIARNEEEFKNPRDPTTINVVKAFATYDQQKAGSISVEDLKAMCKKFDVPIDREQIQILLKECNCEDDGEIDFVKFCEYLTAHRQPQKMQGDFTSTNIATYSNEAQNPSDMETSEDGGYKNGTNFTLGYDEGDSSSVYRKDFQPSGSIGTSKPPFAPGPPCSKVMHEYPSFGSSTSVNRRDYVKHDPQMGRLHSLQIIEERQRNVAVDMRCGPVGQNIFSSETTLSFSAPDAAYHAELRTPQFKEYHHLQSDRALPHPLVLDTCSEAQGSYRVPIENEGDYAAMTRETTDERNARVETNKSTHFVAGYDPPRNETEQMSQFTAKKPLEPNIMAAGRPDLPTKGYSIIAHDSGETGAARGTRDPQQILQQRNYLKNINPRDTVNINLRKAFLEYDKNLCGAISRDDLAAVCKDMEVEISESDLDDIIARCDLKGDGLIDYHEFSLNLSRLQPPSVALLGVGSEDFLTSTAHRDYKHPKDQRVDPRQRIAQEKDSKRFEPVPTQPSRLFQWAAQPDALQSIKMKDFQAPESVLAASYK